METVVAALASFVLGAIAAWAVCVFALHLPWETSLLVIEVGAVGAGVLGGALAYRRTRASRA